MQNSSQSEIIVLIARYQSRLRGLVRCLLVRPADVDDVLQEINSVLWEKATEFQMGTDFWAWASQIARFKAINPIRKYNRDRLVFDDQLLKELADLADESLYGPEGHLSKPYRIFSSDTNTDRRHELISNWFGPMSDRWIQQKDDQADE